MDPCKDVVPEAHKNADLQHQGRQAADSSRGHDLDDWGFLETPLGEAEQPPKPVEPRAARAAGASRKRKPRPHERTAGDKDVAALRAAHATHAEAAEELARQYDRLVPLRSEIIALRQQAAYVSEEYNDHRRWLSKSQKDLLDGLAFWAKAVQVVSPATPGLQTQYEAMLEDGRKLDEVTKTLKSKEDEISGLMSRFEVEDEAFMESAGKLKQSAVALSASSSKSVRMKSRKLSEYQEPQKPTAASPLELHPLLEAFLDRLGSVQMMQERVDLLAAEYAEAEIERSFRTDRGEPVTPPEDVFQDDFRSAIAQAEQTLAEVSEAFRHAREACVANDISTKDYEQAAENPFPDLIPTPAPYEAADSYELHDPSELDLDNDLDIMTPETSALVARTMPGQAPQKLAHRSGALISQRDSPAQRKENVKLRVADWIDVSTDQAAPTAQERAADFLAQDEALRPSTLSTQSSPTLVPTIRTSGSEVFLDRAQSDPHIAHVGGGKSSTPSLARRYSDSQMFDLPQLFDTRQETFHNLRSSSL